MKEFNEENLSTAISLGTDICKELGICCSERGRVIYKIYNKLEQLKSVKAIVTEGGNVPESTRIEAEKPKGLQI